MGNITTINPENKKIPMVINTVIYSMDQKFLDKFLDRGIKAKFITNGISIELPKKTESKIYTMPTECNVDDLCINVAEEGGCTEDGGFSIIVCGRKGKALKPYRITTKEETKNGEHALFSVLQSVATVRGRYGDDYVIIETHDIKVNKNGEVRIKTRLKWEGNLKNLPIFVLSYRKAAKAAYEKSNCYNCNHVHYVQEGCYNS